MSSKILSTYEVRKKWLDFFQQKGYQIIKPVSLIPHEDPSLLWINSGVATLKKYFNNPDLAPAPNLVNCQRVIRTADLANINQHSYHQTLFEMLGIFSIGGNFKTETIPYFWEFFTSSEWLNLKPERLFITVYQQDETTYQLWKKQKGILLNHILFGSKEINFWDMGDGPCGPNTEIYYDFRTDDTLPKKASDLDSKRFLEICNIVLPDSYHKENEYLPLKKNFVDVGAGLERITMVVQNKKNTFQIDLWEPVVKLISDIHAQKFPDK